MNFDEKVFGKRLRKLRENRGMTQKQLADIVGFTRNAISGYETFSRKPDIKMVCLFAEIFMVSTDYLLGMVDRRDFCA